MPELIAVLGIESLPACSHITPFPTVSASHTCSYPACPPHPPPQRRQPGGHADEPPHGRDAVQHRTRAGEDQVSTGVRNRGRVAGGLRWAAYCRLRSAASHAQHTCPSHTQLTTAASQPPSLRASRLAPTGTRMPTSTGRRWRTSGRGWAGRGWAWFALRALQWFDERVQLCGVCLMRLAPACRQRHWNPSRPPSRPAQVPLFLPVHRGSHRCAPWLCQC